MSIFSKFKKTKSKEEKKKEGKKEEKKIEKGLKEQKKEEVLLKKKSEEKKRVAGVPGELYQILLRPLVTEKSTDLQKKNQYVFAVKYSANKIEVKKAVEKIYGVKVEKVRIIKMPGKRVRYGRTQGKTKRWKKAIVFLPKEEKIDVFGSYKK